MLPAPLSERFTMALPGSYSYAVPITKSDTVSFLPVGTQPYCDAIYVATAGVVAVVLVDGTVVNFTCIAGAILPVRAIRVNATNTVPTLMNALYYC
jgi:hypothetical protein